jgi:hypothetical protein
MQSHDFYMVIWFKRNEKREVGGAHGYAPPFLSPAYEPDVTCHIPTS